jgi:hypothetical protein
MEFCILKTKGTFYRIPKAPFESDEQSMDRIWYIAKQESDKEAGEGEGSIDLSESLKWSYQKYLKVKY